MNRHHGNILLSGWGVACLVCLSGLCLVNDVRAITVTASVHNTSSGQIDQVQIWQDVSGDPINGTGVNKFTVGNLAAGVTSGPHTLSSIQAIGIMRARGVVLVEGNSVAVWSAAWAVPSTSSSVTFVLSGGGPPNWALPTNPSNDSLQGGWIRAYDSAGVPLTGKYWVDPGESLDGVGALIGGDGSGKNSGSWLFDPAGDFGSGSRVIGSWTADDPGWRDWNLGEDWSNSWTASYKPPAPDATPGLGNIPWPEPGEEVAKDATVKAGAEANKESVDQGFDVLNRQLAGINPRLDRIANEVQSGFAVANGALVPMGTAINAMKAAVEAQAADLAEVKANTAAANVKLTSIDLKAGEIKTAVEATTAAVQAVGEDTAAIKASTATTATEVTALGVKAGEIKTATEATTAAVQAVGEDTAAIKASTATTATEVAGLGVKAGEIKAATEATTAAVDSAKAQAAADAAAQKASTEATTAAVQAVEGKIASEGVATRAATEATTAAVQAVEGKIASEGAATRAATEATTAAVSGVESRVQSEGAATREAIAGVGDKVQGVSDKLTAEGVVNREAIEAVGTKVQGVEAKVGSEAAATRESIQATTAAVDSAKAQAAADAAAIRASVEGVAAAVEGTGSQAHSDMLEALGVARGGTNLVGSLAGKLDGATNILGGIKGGIDVSTNLLGAIYGALTNEPGPPDLGGQVALGQAAAGEGKAALEGLAGSFVGPPGTTATAADEAWIISFGFPGGGGGVSQFGKMGVGKASAPGGFNWQIDCNPAHYPSVVALADMVKSVLGWLVLLAFVYAVTQEVGTYIRASASIQQARSAGTTVLGSNVNSAAALLCAGAIVVILATIPAFAVSYVNGMSIGTLANNPFNGGPLAWAMAMQVVLMFVPLDVILYDLMIYVAFRLNIAAVFTFASWVVRFIVG